jgi:hypothetical protein
MVYVKIADVCNRRVCVSSTFLSHPDDIDHNWLVNAMAAEGRRKLPIETIGKKFPQ